MSLTLDAFENNGLLLSLRRGAREGDFSHSCIHGDSGYSAGEKYFVSGQEQRIHLTPTGLLMEGVYTNFASGRKGTRRTAQRRGSRATVLSSSLLGAVYALADVGRIRRVGGVSALEAEVDAGRGIAPHRKEVQA